MNYSSYFFIYSTSFPYISNNYQKYYFMQFFMFFKKRNSLGRNDNPNATEFKSAFRKLLVCHPLTTSVDRNTITNATGILTASSSRKPPQKRNIVRTPVQEYDMEIDYIQLMLEEIQTMESYEQHLDAYLALCVEDKLMQNTNRNLYKCNECAHILCASKEKINDELLAMKNDSGPAKQPSESTLKIVIFANGVMKLISSKSDQGNNFEAVQKTIFNNLDIDSMYTSADFVHIEGIDFADHKEKFINEIIKTYMTLKSRNIGRKITDEEQGELIRQRRTDAIHKAGQ